MKVRGDIFRSSLRTCLAGAPFIYCDSVLDMTAEQEFRFPIHRWQSSLRIHNPLPYSVAYVEIPPRIYGEIPHR